MPGWGEVSGSGTGSDWIDDVIDHTIVDELTLAPVAGDRYIPASAGNAALTDILHELTFAAAGYISCLAGDIGLTVTDGVNSGILESYDNVAREWIVSGLAAFTPGPITIGGGVGAGTLTTDAYVGIQLAGNVTVFMTTGDVLHVRGGLNRGWYTLTAAPAFNGVNTNVLVAQPVIYLSIIGSAAHWNLTGQDWASIGVDKVAMYDGVNWVTVNTPTVGTTAYQSTILQFITFGGNTWGIFAATVDHSLLLNLLVDSHTQYLLLAGRAAGQTAYGGSLAATNLNIAANSVTAATSNLLLSDAGVTLHAAAATTIGVTVGVGVPITLYTTYSDVLTLHPTTTSTQDLGDATHIWQKLYCEEVGIYDTTGAEAASITRSLTDFAITANSVGVANLSLTGTNISATLGDALGVDLFAVYSSAPAIVFQVNSLGILSGTGVVNAFVGAADVGKVVALNAAGQIALGFIAWGSVDHNSLNNLAVGDVHTMYPLSIGRAGGQSIWGGTNPNDVLSLRGSDGNDGFIDLQDLTYMSNAQIFRYRDALGNGKNDNLQISVNTAGAVATTLYTYALTDLTVVHVDATVLGIKDGGTERALYHLSALVYRAGGNATIQGVPVSIHSEESDPAWDCTINVAGNNVYVTVTGVAITAIRWTAQISLTEVI
jgi:hypothetical protein